MKIAIIHYHLNRGGVTQVVANHLRSLAALGTDLTAIEEVKIVYGGRHVGWPKHVCEELQNLRVSLVVEPTLEYDQTGSDELRVQLPETLRREQLLADDTLLHIHNHSIGKNAALINSIRDLAEQGYRQLLQVHDFAEDYRPGNYVYLTKALANEDPGLLGARLYPQASHLHYATLNGRDHSLLARAGIPADRLHLLPNPVTPVGSSGDRARARSQLKSSFGIGPDRRFILYPVRPIRRKNFGELLLWSAFSESTSYGVTLVPMNEIERRPFERWRQLIDDLQLPVATGLGEDGGLTFDDNLAAADAVITTSIAEGFGMVYLESWLAGCPLIGRDLPEITSDFRAAGVQFPALSPQLAIPIDWLDDLAELRELFAETLNELLESFGKARLPLPEARSKFDQLVNHDTIDFASLDAARQVEVVRLTRNDRKRQDQLRALNPSLAQASQVDRERCSELTSNNARCVERSYSPTVSGRKLLTLYQHLANCPIGDVTDLEHGGSILDTLLAPERLQLIRIQP